MSYLVLARRYRPQRFVEVVGQEVAARALRRAVARGRLAHAYLFAGTRGVGKTTLARILAMAVNCERPEDGEPCLACSSCEAIREGRALDVVEMDAASHTGVDDVRELLEAVRYPPAQLARKVYIIDEAHMLSKAAFNALLKTLEEPPAHALFVLATTEAEKVPPTVRSRCQRFDLERLPAATIRAHLANVFAQEGIEAEEAALALLARAADGSLRDALSLAERMIALEDGRMTRETVQCALGLLDPEMAMGISDAILAGEGRRALEVLRRAVEKGHAPRAMLTSLLALWRRLACALHGAELGEDLGEAEQAWIANRAHRVPWLALDLRVQTLAHGLAELAYLDEVLGAELLVMRLCGLGELDGWRLAMGDASAQDARGGQDAPKVEASQPQAFLVRAQDWSGIVTAFEAEYPAEGAILAHAEGVQEAGRWRVRVPRTHAAACSTRVRECFARWLGEPVIWEEGEVEDTPARQAVRVRKQQEEAAWKEAQAHPVVQSAIRTLGMDLVEVRPPDAGQGGDA